MADYVLGYTREPIDNVLYDPRLAYSLHLALSGDGVHFGGLNHNSGVLFALATENGDGSLNPMSLKNPWLFRLRDGRYGVLAVRIPGDGGEDESSRGAVLFWTTKDLLEYREEGLIALCGDYVERAACVYREEQDAYELEWRTEDGTCYRALRSELTAGGVGGTNGAVAGGAAGTPGDVAGGAGAEATSAGGMAGDTAGTPGGAEISAGAAAGDAAGMTGGVATPVVAFAGDIAGTDGNAELISGEPELLGEWIRNGRTSEADPARALVTENMTGAVIQNIIEVPPAVADRLRKKLTTPENVGVSFPELVEVHSREELEARRATLLYSDGGTDSARVDWELGEVDFDLPGQYRIRGRVHQDSFPFPVAFNRADPCIGRWQGKYYFISTNDADHEHTIYVREADTIPGLVTAEDHLILDAYTYEGIGGLLWAPEFHEINGKFYIFHAATPGEFFREESHVMELREGGNPACREDWSAPRRVVRKDGSELCRAGETITLDMTCFPWEGKWYACWSQRQFLPKDLGAWLYVAELDPEKPWMLASDPVVLSKPDYGWGNNHTFVEEGPFAVPSTDGLYLTFSAAAVDTSYVVGYLALEKGNDPLIRENWRKNNYPILTSRSVEGEYGTGHNAYVTDEEGGTWNTYHARPGTEGVRSSGIRRVYFDVDGAPVLDVTEELGLKEEFRQVETTLKII